MKKATAIILALMLVFAVGLTVSAAGADDGSIKVATVSGKKFFGTEIGENAVKYVAANGGDELFYDLTDDRSMNVCDLVALSKNETDLDENGEYSPADGALLRSMLIG